MKGLIVPEASEDFTADPVELFFDLAFVFAFSQLVWLLVHHPTWTGALEAMLLFAILWLAWSTFTWAANAVQGNARPVRAIFLVATAVSIPMGAAVRSAYGSGGGTFAVCAALIVLLGIGLQAWGLGSSGAEAEFQSLLRYGAPNLLATVILVGGAWLDPGPRKVAWVLFILVIIGGMAAARSGDWLVRPGHFAERHGLIVIIALGEIVVAMGISVVDSLDEADGLPGQTLVALVAAGVLAGLLWWSYFDRVLPALEHRAEALVGRPKAHFIADAYTSAHMVIVPGIIALAAAAEEILLHPKDAAHTEFLVMFVAGLALFYGGISIAVFRGFKMIAKERLAATAAVALVAWLGRDMSGVVFLLMVDAVLLINLVLEHLRIEGPSNARNETAVASG